MKQRSVKKQTALKGSKTLIRSAGKVLYGRYRSNDAQHMLEEAKREFDALIPGIPYLGGRKNIYSGMAVKAAAMLALYRALQNEGVSLEEYGEILEAAAKQYMIALPSWIRAFAGRLWMSQLFRRIMIRQAKISQKKKLPGGFRFRSSARQWKYPMGNRLSGVRHHKISGQPRRVRTGKICMHSRFCHVSGNWGNFGAFRNDRPRMQPMRLPVHDLMLHM